MAELAWGTVVALTGRGDCIYFGVIKRSPHQGILWSDPCLKENRGGGDYFGLSGSPKLLFFALLQLHRLSRLLEN